MAVKNVLLVGVGGQGTILASKLLTIGLVAAGYDVKMSEIHGMSQRGGSVSTQVRFGDHVDSPVIEAGGADMIVSFELMEALRWLSYLKPQGCVVVNQFRINPMPVASGKAVYPDDILERLQAAAQVVALDAAKIAAGLGNPRVMNVVLLGTIIRFMQLEDIDWEKIVRDNVKPAFADLNVAALRAGMAAL